MRLNVFNSLMGLCVATAAVSCSDALVDDVNKRPVGGESDMISFVVADQNNTTRGGSFGNRPCGGAILRSANGTDSLYLNVEVSDITDDHATRAVDVTDVNDLSQLYMSCVRRDAGNVYSYYFENTSFSKNGDVWSSDSPYFWLTANTHFKFYGYYAPSDAEGVEFHNNIGESITECIPSIDYTVPSDVTEQFDLSYSVSSKAEYIANEKIQVPVTLKHALSKIVFKTGTIASTITGIEIRNVYTKGKLNLETGDWTELAEKMTMELSGVKISDNNQPITPEDNSFMLLPGSILEDSELAVYIEGETKPYTASLKDCKWEAGKQYTYTINIEPEFGMEIDVVPEIVDAHYVIAKAHVNVPENEKDLNWTLSVSAEGVASNASPDKIATITDVLDEYQKQGFWTDRILFQAAETTTSVDQGSARGEASLSGSGSKDVYIFIPENNGNYARKIALELKTKIKNTEKYIVSDTKNFDQKCPDWNNEFGWEEIEEYAEWIGSNGNFSLKSGNPEAPWGYIWNRTVVYQRNNNRWNFLVYTPMVQDLVTQYNASDYTEVDPGGFFGIGGYVKITIKYNNLNSLKNLNLTNNDGLFNTQKLYTYSGGAVTGALEDAIKNITGMEKKNDTGSEVNSESAALSLILKKNKYDLKKIEKKDEDGTDVSKSVYIKSEDIVWYMPAQNQLTISPSNTSLNGSYWSSTPDGNLNAFTNSGTSERGNSHKIRACRKKDKKN